MWKRDQDVAPAPVTGASREHVVEVKPGTSPPPLVERRANDLGKSVVIKGELSGSEI